MKKLEPAYSFLHDHSGLSNPNIVFDFDILLIKVSSLLDNPLNLSQSNVFKHSFKNRMTLLWGPPGTGKTATLASIVLGWLEYAEETHKCLNICIGSSNWTAIDNLLGYIDDVLETRKKKAGNYDFPIELNRIRSSSGKEFFHERICDVIVGSPKAEKLKKNFDNNTLVTINGSTWKQLYNLSKNNKQASGQRWFDLLLIDEASQVKVAHAAGYFLFLKENGIVILAGDDKQLGPIHSFQMQDSSNGLYECIYTYMKDTHKITPLAIVDNYRSNLIINEWPNKRFYGEKLCSKNPDNRLNISLPKSVPDNWPKDLEWTDEYLKILNPDNPIVVITYPKSIHTVSNTFEAQIVSAICCLYRLVLGNNISEDEFAKKYLGIVTPHRAQRSLIQNFLINSDINITNGGFIDTVDRFQGQERDLILSSYSVSDKDFVSSEDEFILNSRRFNVSLTRAKHKFIMIISEALIDYLPNDKLIAEDASHIQMFVEKFCGIEEKITLNFREYNCVKEIECKIKYN